MQFITETKRQLKPLSALLFFSVILSFSSINAQEKLPSRDQIGDSYKWNLADVYPSLDLWEQDFKWIESSIPKYSQYKGKLGKSAKDLLNAIKFNEEVQIKYERLSLYPFLANDIEITNGKYQVMDERVKKLGSELSAALSFWDPELLSMPKSKIDKFVKEEKGLAVYAHEFDNLFRMKDHTLSSREEEIMALTSPVYEIPVSTFGILNDAELPFPTVKDEKGNDMRISHGRYRAALYSTDRSYRERVYKGTYVPYRQLKGTFATIFNGRVKERIANAKIRKYPSALEASLYGSNIPVSVYKNLIDAFNRSLPSLQRWASIKKRVLNLNELHPYDSYTSLFPGVQKQYTYDEAKQIVIEALKPLGEEYITALKAGLESRWVDVYETEAKRSGAYSMGYGYGVHPFILLNWNGTLDDVFTLCHELGHNMHAYFTEKHQPYVYANYSSFLAEIASTTNEALLLDYLIEKASSKEEKLALIEKYIENVQQTFFRQAGFAEFEMIVHEKAEKGEFMDADQLTALFKELYQRQWGKEMVVDEEEGLTWARVPHFINYNFYVYQYATGFAAAQAMSEIIKKEGQPAIDRYLNFLYSGSSVYPIELMKKTGIDMTTPQPVQLTMEKMNKYMDQLEELLKKS